MGGKPLQYITISLTVFIDVLGFGIVIPVLPIYAEHFGATTLQIGWLVGIFSLMQFFFAPVWGSISDRIGRKPVLLIGLLGTVISYILMGLADTVVLLFVARFLSGIGGANIGAAQAYLADISTPENRARAMGLLGAAFGLGFVFGPALGGWAGAQFNYAAPMYIAAGLSFLNIISVILFLPESHRPGSGKRQALFPGIFAHVRRQQYFWSIAVYFLVILGFSMMTTLFALYLKHRFDLTILHTGYILAGIGMIGVIIQGGLIGRLVKRFGETSVALAGTLCMCAGLAGLGFSSSFGMMLFTSALIGVGNSLIMPTISALCSKAADVEWQGRALGLMQSGGSLARAVGPVMAGFLLSVGVGPGHYAFLPLIVASVFLAMAGAVMGILSQLQKTQRIVSPR